LHLLRGMAPLRQRRSAADIPDSSYVRCSAAAARFL
jgi:hypothetical protein